MALTEDTGAEQALEKLFFTPEGRSDPYPLYRLMRERAPVLRHSAGLVVLTRYEDCLETLRNPRFGRAVTGTDAPRAARLPGAADAATRRRFFEHNRSSMLMADPPAHTRLRRLANRAFTPKRVEALRHSVTRTVREVVSGVAEAGSVDIMTELAFPLPVTVIGEMVGVPAADRPAFRPLVRTSSAGLEPFADNATLEAAMAAREEMRAYFTDLLAERRARPADDLLSGLAQAREAGDALSDEEVIVTAILLFAAGFETTTNLIGNGLLALLRNPDQFERLRREPDLARSTVEELLRYDSPVQVNIRTALEPAEIDGENIEAGQAVLVLQGAANRDPSRFPEPDALDVTRADNVPLSFGWGAHHCLGAPLARLEGEVVFRELATSFRAIELAASDLEWRAAITLRGLSALPVRVRG